MSKQDYKYWVISLVAAIFIFNTLSIRAGLVENLYQSELLVSDDLRMPDQLSLSLGIKSVLVKVSGAVMAAAFVDELGFDNKGYLSEFRIESTRMVRTDVSGNDYLAQNLIMQFDPESINSLLLSHGLKPLGKYRPKFLVWLLGDVESIGFDHYKEAIEENAAILAFPVEVVFDHDYREGVSDNRLLKRIGNGSKTYGKVLNVVVIIDAEQQFRWRVLEVESDQWQSVRGEFGEQLAETFQLWIRSAGLQVMGENVKQINTHQITVTSVKNMSDYAAIMEYILSLSSIEQVNIVSMSNETLIISLQSSLSAAALTQVLSFDRRMLRMRSLQEDASADFLRWRWFSSRGK